MKTVSFLLLNLLIPFSVSAASIPQGAQRVALLQFGLEAGCDSDALVSSITIKHSGLGATSDILRVYLGKNGQRISPTVSFSNKESTAILRPQSLTIPSCSSGTFQVLADFSPDAAAGGQHRLTIKNIATSKGSIHLANTSKSISAETIAGEAEGITATFRALHASVRYGNSRTVARMQLESDAQFDQRITSITLTNKGSAHDGDLVNIRLYDGDKLLAPAVKQMNDDTITFNPDPTFILTSNQSLLLTVKADVRGRAKRTIDLTVDEPSDIEAVRQQRSR